MRVCTTILLPRRNRWCEHLLHYVRARVWCAVVTNKGGATETLWVQTGVVSLPQNFDSMRLPITQILANEAQRNCCGRVGRELYACRFYLRYEIVALRAV